MSQTSPRYTPQTRLPEIGEAGQSKLANAEVFIVGIGGLGSPVAMYLAAAGVGRLVLADFDRVEESNLQRQIIHRHADIGELKAASAARTLRALNPAVEVRTLDYVLDADDFREHARTADLIADCTDNFASRLEMNRASLATGTPLVSGAAIRWEGQVTTFHPAPENPCYQCLYPDPDVDAPTCESEGVIGPLVGVIGAMQALEAIHTILGTPQLPGTVWLLDAHQMEWQRMTLPKNPACPACSP